uniref:EF-hand calcium-binding domain-containing protein 13-like n=1 Tax=Callospermophilus lateralis TaxID=76772 RepID=UPI004038D4EB
MVQNHNQEQNEGNQMVDIGDIVFALNELQQPYEDVSITEDSAPDETTLDSELPNVAGHSLQRSLPARPSESSILKNLNGKSLQYHSNIMENDETEFKQSRSSWPVGQFLGRVDSNHEIHDPKSVPQSLKNVISLSKSLDKIDISSVPKLEKLVVRRPSTLLKQVSSEEKPAITTLVLPDVTDNLHNISKEQMNVSDLWNILSTLNSNLKKDEFLAALKFTIVDDDKVQFDEFTKTVKNMCDASRLKEFQEIALALDSLEGDMISGENLEDFLRNIGIKSPKEEVEKILQSHFVSEDNMVNIKDCMRALRDTQKFSNFIALNETINKLDCMKEGSRSDKDKYSDILENTDRHFPDNTLQKTEDDSFVEDIKEAAHFLSHVDNGKIDIPNLKHALKCLNANLTEEDINEALKRCDISDNMVVDLKDFLLEMKENPHFKESKGLQVEAHDIDNILGNMVFKLTPEELNDLTPNLPVDASGKVNFDELMDGVKIVTANEKVDLDKLMDGVKVLTGRGIDFSDLEKVLGNMGINLTDKDWLRLMKNLPTDGTIDVSKLDTVLGNMGMKLTEKEFKDLTQNLPVDVDGKVTLKTVMDEVKKFSGEKVDLSDLQNLLRNMGIEITEIEYSELKKTLPTDAAGQVIATIT